jgi:shikimate kinase
MLAPAAMPNATPRIDRPIVLVGLMGAGKTTVGRRLAKRLGLPFADSDEEIERSSGYTIAEIFERFGESAFRDGERRTIHRLIDGRPKVIAIGGGAFMDESTRALILSRCTAIWLDADVEILVGRLRRLGHRPLLHGRDPRAVIEGLAELRNPVYAQAHLRIRSAPAPHEAVVDAICRELQG